MKRQQIVRLDVREDIRNGREPFGRVMAAVGALEDGQALCLVAPFEPKPLFGVLAARGYSHQSKPLDSGDYEVLFTPSDAPSPADSAATGICGVPILKDVDTRGLQPPEPLVKILEALAGLPDNAELLAITERRPMHLYAQLTERGYTSQTEESPDGSYLTRIRRA